MRHSRKRGGLSSCHTRSGSVLEKAIAEYDAGRLLPDHKSGRATRGGTGSRWAARGDGLRSHRNAAGAYVEEAERIAPARATDATRRATKMNADGEEVGTSGSTKHSTNTFASSVFKIEDFRAVMVMNDTFCLHETGHQSSCAWPGFPNHCCPLAFRSARSIRGSGPHVDSRAGIVRCAQGILGQIGCVPSVLSLRNPCRGPHRRGFASCKTLERIEI